MTPAEERFKRAVQELVRAKLYPSPQQIRAALGREASSHSYGGPVINGRECAWRKEVLLELGWTYTWKDGRRYAWTPPKGEAVMAADSGRIIISD